MKALQFMLLLLCFTSTATAQNLRLETHLNLKLQYEAYADAKNSAMGSQIAFTGIQEKTGLTGRVAIDFFDSFTSNLNKEYYNLTESSSLEIGAGYTTDSFTALLLLGDTDTNSTLPQHTKYVGTEFMYRLGRSPEFDFAFTGTYKRSVGDEIQVTNQERDIFELGMAYIFKIPKKFK